jgi:two-component sensor histidine kinase
VWPVVNELITNAFRYAFPSRRRGEVYVALTRQPGDEALFSVSDDGVGLSNHIDPATAFTLGLRLVNLLANRIRGTITTHRSNPTRFPI